MSGRKYSRYQVEQNIRQALECGLEAKELAAEAEARLKALREFAREVPGIQAVWSSAQNAVSEIRKALVAIETELQRKRWVSLPLDRVVGFRDELAALRKRLGAEITRCLAGHERAARWSELRALEHQILAQENELRDWKSASYDVLRQRVEATLKSAADPSPVAADVSALHQDLLDLQDEVRSLRLQDQERRYVLLALENVCLSLGFEVTVKPAGKPIDDLVADVNTFSHGVISFRLELGGTIRSESQIVPASCGTRYEEIEDKLRNIGVQTAFCFEEDGRPIRRQRGEMRLPDSARTQSSSVGTSNTQDSKT